MEGLSILTLVYRVRGSSGHEAAMIRLLQARVREGL